MTFSNYRKTVDKIKVKFLELCNTRAANIF